ncbi:MAG: hypothetical protein Q9214_004317 [Letrouitia sp. 1 TL-2023]
MGDSYPVQSPLVTAAWMEGIFDSAQKNYVFDNSGPAQPFRNQEVIFTGQLLSLRYPHDVAVPETYLVCYENGLERVWISHYGPPPQVTGNLQTWASHEPESYDAFAPREDYSYLMNEPWFAGNDFNSPPDGQDGTRGAMDLPTPDLERHFVPKMELSNAIPRGLTPIVGNESYVHDPLEGKESANIGPNPKALDITQRQSPRNLRELSVPEHKVVPPMNRKMGHQKAPNGTHPRNDARCNVLQPKYNQGLQCKPLRRRKRFTTAEKEQIKRCRDVGACSSCRARKCKVRHGPHGWKKDRVLTTWNSASIPRIAQKARPRHRVVMVTIPQRHFRLVPYEKIFSNHDGPSFETSLIAA